MRFHALVVALLTGLPFSLTGCNSNNDRTAGVKPSTGAVYVPTNEANNRVIAYQRLADGTLTLIDAYATQGQGTAGRIIPALDRVVVDPLFSQDSAVITPDRRLLFVVNAGDGTITSFRINADRSLTFADRETTGGMFPNTLAANGALLYVANVNSPNNPLHTGGNARATLVGFRYASNGELTFIDNSTRTLSSDASMPTQVLFNVAGDRLIVVELFARTISVYPVLGDGTLGTPRTNPTTVDVFGATAIEGDTLLTANVSPIGVTGAGSASSYMLMGDGAVLPITEGVANGKTSPCWTAVTPDRRFLYTANLDDGDVSLFEIGASRQLTVSQPTAARLDSLGALSANNVSTSGPADSFITADGAFLYQQYSGRGEVIAYRISPDGHLVEIGGFCKNELPLVGAEGLVGF